ncbi:hypothetical protein HK096_009821, partial [Nowakowskiella sp. JEL0078]
MADMANTEQISNNKADLWKEKLEKLSKLRDQSKKDNRLDVYAENEKRKENPKLQIRQERKRKEAEELLAEAKAEEKGEDFIRIKAYSWSAEDVEKWEERQKEKESRVDKGFT